MKKEVFEIDSNGYITEKNVAEFDDDGNCLEDLAENIIKIQPLDGLYRAKWTGMAWIEDMSQSEINAMKNTVLSPLAQLSVTDKGMARVAEDLIDILIAKGTIAETDLPETVRQKLAERKQLRSQISSQ